MAVRYPPSVISRQVTDPPTEMDDPPVELGDAYLVPAGSSGDWATKADNIALWTARGWAFIPPMTGVNIYVTDEGGYYHYSGSMWLQGLGNNPLPASSLPLSTAINFGKFVLVENRTTNTPPSVAQGVAYIIGSAPTGAWTGQSGKVAIRELPGTGNVFTIYTPPQGMRAYDKSDGRDFQFNGLAWVPASGNFKRVVKIYDNSTTWTKPEGLIAVLVWCVGGGGGGAGAGGNGGNGGTSSFGGVNGFGGQNGTSAGTGGNGGGGSGGSSDGSTYGGGRGGLSDGSGAYGVGGPAKHPWFTMSSGAVDPARSDSSAYGRGSGGGSLSTVGGTPRAGGGGGTRVAWIDAGSLSAGESVTVGSGGTAGASGGLAGIGGLVVIEEYIAQ